MSKKLYTLAFAALATALTASAVDRNIEIRQPAQITANDVVQYHDPVLDNAPKAVDMKNLISARHGSNTGRLKAASSNPADFTLALDTVAKEFWIVKCASKDSHVIIPDEIEVNGVSYPVTVIYTQAFSGLQTMTELTFGKNIREVMSSAFVACMFCTKMNLNEGLIKIGDTAFGTFMTKITSLELPSTVEELGERCFSGTGLTGEFIINKNLRKIGGGAFAAKKITGFYINEDGNNYFTSVDGALFTKDGESLVVYPPALVTATLTLPDGLKKIAPYAFAYSTVLTKVNLPSSLTEIGEFAFRGCKLSEFTVGKNLVKMGDGVLVDNKTLTTLTVEDGNTNFKMTNNLLIDKANKRVIALPYNATAVNVPDGMEGIGKSLCYMNTNITEVSAPASMKVIDDMAFYQCSAIASINLQGVEKIGTSCFHSVKKTPKVVLPAGLKYIGKYAFASGEIAEFVVPENIDTIEYGAWMQSKIENINIPGTTKYLADALFYQCTSLSKLTLGEGMTRIPDIMCYGCEKLYFLDFPSTIKEVGASAFSFSWLQIADLPEGCVKVCNGAFQLAPLHYINMPNSLVEVEDLGFSLTNAEYVKCGTGLKKLGANSLQSAKLADYITLNEGLESIGYRALYGEAKISEITIPSTVKEIGDSALIITPLKRLVNLSKTPQPLTSAITGNPYDPYPVVKPIYDTCTLVVPAGCKQAYSEANIWKLYENIEELQGSEVEGIEVKENVEIVKIYGIDGALREKLGNGINICVMSDGTVVKRILRQ